MVMAEPLLGPAVKLIVADWSPAVMDVIVGAAGAATGVTDCATDAVPSPCAFTAFSFT